MIMQLDADNIEKKLRKALPYFFVLVFITTVAGAFLNYLNHHPWKIGDWLINYQGGMIRRGLFGEVVYRLSYLTHINPGVYVIIFQIFLYAVFFLFSYLLLKKQQSLLPYVFLIFSPVIFTLQINYFERGFRKEIIYFALLAFVTWIASLKKHKTFERIFYITLLFYPAAILTHEMLALFLPYLLVVYFSITPLTKKNLFLVAALVSLSIASFLVVIGHLGTLEQAAEIYASIARENYPITGGAILRLGKDVSFARETVATDIINNYHYLYYILIVGLSSLAYIPVYGKLKLIIKNKLSLLMIVISLVGTIALFSVATDWGRFIYINLVSIFFLTLIPMQNIENHQKYNHNRAVNIFIAVSSIINICFGLSIYYNLATSSASFVL